MPPTDMEPNLDPRSESARCAVCCALVQGLWIQAASIWDSGSISWLDAISEALDGRPCRRATLQGLLPQPIDHDSFVTPIEKSCMSILAERSDTIEGALALWPPSQNPSPENVTLLCQETMDGASCDKCAELSTSDVEGSLEKRLRIVTVVTNPAPSFSLQPTPSTELHVWRLLGGWSPVPLTILGDGMKYHPGLKPHLYYQYLSSLDDSVLDRVIFLLLDSSDVIFNGDSLSAEVVLRRYFSLVRRFISRETLDSALPVVISAETNCWVGLRHLGNAPEGGTFTGSQGGHCTVDEERALRASLMSVMLNATGDRRYPNSGIMMGPGRSLVRMFSSVKNVVFADDQFFLIHALMRAQSFRSESLGESPHILLDSGEEIFGSLLDVIDCDTGSVFRGYTCGPPPLVRQCCVRSEVSSSALQEYAVVRRGERCLVRRVRSNVDAPLLWHGHGASRGVFAAVAQTLLTCGQSSSGEGSQTPLDRLRSFKVEYWPYRLSCGTLHCAKRPELRAYGSLERMWTPT